MKLDKTTDYGLPTIPGLPMKEIILPENAEEEIKRLRSYFKRDSDKTDRKIEVFVDGKKHIIDLDDPIYQGLAASENEPGIIKLDKTTDYGLPKIPQYPMKPLAPSENAEEDIKMFSDLL